MPFLEAATTVGAYFMYVRKNAEWQMMNGGAHYPKFKRLCALSPPLCRGGAGVGWILLVNQQDTYLSYPLMVSHKTWPYIWSGIPFGSLANHSLFQVDSSLFSWNMLSELEKYMAGAYSEPVLILVLMEYALGERCECWGWEPVGIVLILVLMEYALGGTEKIDKRSRQNCLNPCFNGICFRT